MKNILSFDVEEYFQVSGLQAAVSRNDWSRYPSRVEQNTQKVLDVLSRNNVRATFFVLGWIAEKYPTLIKQIAEQGHETACHGWDHRLAYNMTVEEFALDVAQTVNLLQDITGEEVIGYRAPSFSIGLADIDKFKALAELGLKYDSSIFPIRHFRYGRAQKAPIGPFDIKENDRLILKEFPMSVVNFLGKRIPAGGGGYFRLYPDFFIRRNFRKVNSEGRPLIIYLHPWEFDPDQPRIKKAGLGNTFRHYHNLRKTRAKLEIVLQEFEFCPFIDYLAKSDNNSL